MPLTSYPGHPRPDFISQPWRKIGEFFLHGCEIKSGCGRPGYEVNMPHGTSYVILVPGNTAEVYIATSVQLAQLTIS